METTKSSVQYLLEQLKSGKWSAVKVLVAFAKRSVIAQKYTNCLTDFFLHEALLRADELDSILEATGKPVGPLHGLPFSIKVRVQVNKVRKSSNEQR